MVVLESSEKCVRFLGKSRCLRKVKGGNCPGEGRYCKGLVDLICENCSTVGRFCLNCRLIPISISE